VLLLLISSPYYYLLVWRAYGPVIWIGHGDKDGILLMSHLVSWKNFAKITKLTPAKDIILSCFPGVASLYSHDIIAFGMVPVDAILGAYIVSFILTKEATIITKIIQRIQCIVFGRDIFVPLYLSEIEASYYALSLVAMVVSFYIGYSLAQLYSSATQKIVEKTLEILTWRRAVWWILQLFITYSYMLFDAMDPLTFIINVISAFIEILGAAIDAINSILSNTPWWEISVISFLLSVIGIFVARLSIGAIEFALELVALSLEIIVLVAGLMQDADDDNWWVG